MTRLFKGNKTIWEGRTAIKWCPPSKIFCWMFLATLALTMNWCIWCTLHPSCSFSWCSVCSSLVLPSSAQRCSTKQMRLKWWWWSTTVESNTEHVANHRENIYNLRLIVNKTCIWNGLVLISPHTKACAKILFSLVFAKSQVCFFVFFSIFAK